MTGLEIDFSSDIFQGAAWLSSNHHGPYALGHTRNTMAGTEGSYTAK